ncbi:hypothetical protein V6N13_139617 [Hibiscus sabdariffa]
MFHSLRNRHQSAEELQVIGDCFGYSCFNSSPDGSYHTLPAKEIIQITSGYVPPEYVKKGTYSTKYDVYSFGVLLLQIISGKRNSNLYGCHGNLNLLEYDRGTDFFDASLDDSSSSCKLSRCMQVALFCVQENPVDRPSMVEIFTILKNGSSVAISTPKRPAYSVTRDENKENTDIETDTVFSVNDASITQAVPR